MRTLMFLVGGLALFGACIAVARMLAAGASMTAATLGFVALWFVIAATNLWVGVARAGYSFREELPIFLLIFLLPAAVALVVRWKFL